MKGTRLRNTMTRATLAVAALTVSALVLMAQDFPALRGDLGRTGKSSVPTNGPGLAGLNWFDPNPFAPFRTLVLDNQSAGVTRVDGPAAPYLWTAPATADAASFPYISDPTVTQDYQYVRAEPSAIGSPFTTQSGNAAATNEWSFTPTAIGNFALYVWLPVGPTYEGVTPRYSSRYYTYKIDYGTGKTYTDIVDTFAGGSGLVRLGGGGLPTDRLFSYDGTNPIKITLYNTQPRDGNGALLETGDFVVYADAAFAVGEVGEYQASPTVKQIAVGDIRAVAARNESVLETVNGVPETRTQGVVYSYAHNTGVVQWRFRPAASTVNTNFDNVSAGVTNSPGFTSSTLAAGFRGTDYLEAAVNTTDILTAETVTFAPDTGLSDGEYAIYAYLPGDSNGETFATQATYQVYEGVTLIDTITLDQSVAGGYVQIGTATYNHEQANRLRVVATNYSPNVADAGKKAFVDTIRFVGTASVAINSTPVQARAFIKPSLAGAPVETEVVIAAAENGKIYCLDAVGNGDGTTNVYWTYPSSIDTDSGATDPNQVALEDGDGPIAEMPTGFGKSSGVVARIGTQDFFYIAATNGRVYCIEMAGRGDFTVGPNVAGTTRRAWTFPSDFPQTGESLTVDNAGTVAGWTTQNTATFPFVGNTFLDQTIEPVVGSAVGVTYAPALDDGENYFIDIYVPGDPAYASAQRVEIHQGATVTVVPVDMGTPVTNHWIRLNATALANTTANPLSVVVTNNSVAGADATLRAYSDAVRFSKTTSVATLGAFVGSVTLADTADGPTVFIGAPQGRIYAVDALGDSTSKTTGIRWAYPALTEPTTGPIYMTPTVDFGNVYVGTARRDNFTGPEFLALDADTGALLWSASGNLTVNEVTSATVSTITDVNGDDLLFDDFVSSPATVSSTILGGGEPNTIYLANHNRYIYGINADTGEVRWKSNELNSVVIGGLSYAPMTVLNNGGVPTVDTPTLLIPTSNGRVAGFFAQNVTNRFGRKQVYGFQTEAGEMGTNIAVGQSFMYAGDARGILYAFDNTGSGGGAGAPGTPEVIDNDVSADTFRNAKLVFLNNKTTYDIARLNAAGNTKVSTASTTNFKVPPYAFEWGETAYIMVYDFPYATLTPDGLTTVAPPTVNITISMDGRTLRTIPVQAQVFQDSPGNPNTHGYAVLSFAFQGSGVNAVPPGGGSVSFSIATASLTNAGVNQIIPIGTNPANVNDGDSYNDATADFTLANPLGLRINDSVGTRRVGLNAVGNGTTTNDVQNLTNGNPSWNYGASPGIVQHGQSKSAQVDIYDRSEMFLLRGPGRPGLENLRIQRKDLEWQGGTTAMVKRLPNAYIGFEDLPSRFPNNSLDYPNVQREQVVVTKDPTLSPGNPVLTPVALRPPTETTGGVALTPNNVQDRAVVATPFDFRIGVPQFQPTNMTTFSDGKGNVDAGYRGQVFIVLDSNGNGEVDAANGSREAFREFTLGTAVAEDQRMAVNTPTIDLGSLAAGAGISTTNNPSALAALFTSYATPYDTMFQPFNVTNPGNVNMINVRLAKGTTTTGAWPIQSPSNELNAWIDSTFNLRSDLDPDLSSLGTVSPSTVPVILQKSRVGDRVPTNLAVNPRRRYNPNVGATGLATDLFKSTLPSRQPRVTVTPPIGTPAGQYSQRLRVIEDNGSLPTSDGIYDPALELYSDPGFILKFNVRETRLTSDVSRYTPTMVDDPTVIDNDANPATVNSFARGNIQPAAMRDANGTMIVAWASPAHNWNDLQPGVASTNDQWRIFVSTLDQNGVLGSSPLNDLNAFNPAANNRWFRQTVASYPDLTPYPANDLFGGSGMSDPTIKYGAPAFPALGTLDPFGSGFFANPLLAFVGNGQRTVSGGKQNESRIFVAPLTVTAGGDVTIDRPVPLNADPLVRKSKPSIVQIAAAQAVVFYGGAGTGNSQLFWTLFNNGAYTTPVALQVGNGFETMSGPSATARIYSGATVDASTSDELSSGNFLYELSFVAKMRGRTNNEVFLARLKNQDGNMRVVPVPAVTQERLVAEGGGVFRARGVNWVSTTVPVVEQSLNGAISNLLVANSRQHDRNTGVISYNSRLGGKVYLDPNMGTVRFAGTAPSPSAVVLLSYRPRVLRISTSNTAAYAGPSHAFDQRLGADGTYWYSGSGAEVINTDTFVNDRYLFSYGRAASGNGQASRPYITTMRYGVKLPHGIHTQPDGTPTGAFSVTSATPLGYYQVDPAQGAIYFSVFDENHPVTIQYTAVNSATGEAVSAAPFNATVSLIIERRESAIPIEQAVNESFINLFIDPLGSATINPISGRRPGLLWFFWTSTRAGNPDVYFQTLAPRFTPLPVAP